MYLFWSKSSKTQRNKNAHARVLILQMGCFFFFVVVVFFFFFFEF